MGTCQTIFTLNEANRMHIYIKKIKCLYFNRDISKIVTFSAADIPVLNLKTKLRISYLNSEGRGVSAENLFPTYLCVSAGNSTTYGFTFTPVVDFFVTLAL